MSSYLYNHGDDFVQSVGAQLREAVASRPEGIWEATTAVGDWIPFATSKLLREKPPLDVPCKLLCSAFAPVGPFQESMRELQALTPSSPLVFIPSSKLWWELENPTFVFQEIEVFLQSLGIEQEVSTGEVATEEAGLSSCAQSTECCTCF